MSEHRRNPLKLWSHALRSSLLTVAVAAGDVALGQSLEYTVTKLGKPPGALSAVGVRMNNAGHVAGWSQYADPPTLRGWVWTPEKGFTVLPVPPGFDKYRAMDISDTGIVAGDGGFISGLAWRYENGAYTITGAVEGMPIAYLGGVNNAGDISGTATDTSITTPDLAFLDVNGGTLVNLRPGFNSRATDVNNAGQACGYSLAPSGRFEAVRWEEGGGFQFLGTLGFARSFANAMNDSGQVVGKAQSASGSISQPWIYTDGAGMQTIPALSSQHSAATGINNKGHVVGTTEISGPDIPWLWTGGESVTDLNDLVGVDAGKFPMLAAHDINDAGQILALGFDNNAVESSMALLTPLSPPTPAVSEWGLMILTLLLLCAATVILGKRASRIAV